MSPGDKCTIHNEQCTGGKPQSDDCFLVCIFHCPLCVEIGGADRVRTDDIQLAKLALFQLSYGPVYVCGGNAGTRVCRGRFLPWCMGPLGGGSRGPWSAVPCGFARLAVTVKERGVRVL